MDVSGGVAVICIDVALCHRENVGVACNLIPASFTIEVAHLREISKVVEGANY